MRTDLHRAVVIFSRCGPRWVSRLFREKYGHVAVGDEDVIYDPFMSPAAPFIPINQYRKVIARFAPIELIIPTPRGVFEHETCCQSGSQSGPCGSFAAWVWSVMTFRDCVSLACSRLLSAGVDIPQVFRPSTLVSELARRV